MNRLNFALLPLLAISQFRCGPNSTESLPGSLTKLAAKSEKIEGKQEYLNSPYVTAGDRVYMVGHQDGSFPDLGWHINGEMGGIWDHPIKLMDGFSMTISENGSIWRLDSAKSFHNLPFGNIHHFENNELAVERFQFVPEGQEGLIIEISITNNNVRERDLEFAFTGHVDLRPTWLSERQELVDGEDSGEFDASLGVFLVKDELNPWFVGFGSDESFEPTSNRVSIDREGNGKDYALSKKLILPGKATTSLQFYIAGSYKEKQQVFATLKNLRENNSELLQQKILKYSSLASVNQLITNDPSIDQMYQWIKFNSQWLVREVPEIGRGVSAGIPDYPWWFGTDGAYIVQGLVSAGLHEEALHTIDLIMKLSRSENGNGRIVHEVSSNGVVFNPGNLNTTPTFIIALWKVYEWTGDQRILNEYYDDILKGIEWIDGMDEDRNGYPDGAGMMEIHGLHSEMIDVVAYLAKAYQAVSNFAKVSNDEANATKYSQKAQQLIQKIKTEWWVEESGSFADFRSSKEEALALIDAAIVRADTINKPWSVTELKATREQTLTMPETLQGFVVHHNWVVNTPMEVGLAEPEQAKVALANAETYRNRFGMFVTGIDRDEEQEKAEKWKAFSYVGAVMTLPTGVQAISEANYENVDKSLEYLKMLQNSFSYALPGSMYEVSPDFGMVAQGWNIYSVAVPIVDHFFGIRPSAYEQKITISPRMPSSWNQAKLSNIRVGANDISIMFRREGDVEHYEISQKLDWEIQFDGKTNQIHTIN